MGGVNRARDFAASVLVVTRGEDIGASFAISADAKELVIGRSASAAIRLTDLRVSRQHAVVSVTPGGLRITCLPDTSPIWIDDAETREGVAWVGAQVIVGETVLAVRLPDGLVEASTDVRTLLSGAANDVRGLSAIIALTEALDGAQSRSAIVPALRAWAKRYPHATDVDLVEGRAVRDQVVTRPAGDTKTVVIVPAYAELGLGIQFHLDISPVEVSVAILRLLAVAGRICGSTLVRLDAVERIEKEKDTLRQLAVGSARAFLGESPAAAMVTKLIARLAESEAVALLEGETGVGKTFVARLIHEASPRAQAPLRVVNCAAIPETLLEGELFGHERGAFTGALGARPGLFEVAGRGTLLLDEVGELSLASQAKLLHVLEDKQFTRIGSTRSVALQARILAATNRDLEGMVKEGTFRGDLYFRLSVVRVKIPPLRERGEDIVLLAEQILRDLAASSPRRIEGFVDAALGIIRRYPWPGNVRELRNGIEHALVLGDSPRIAPEDLPPAVRVGAAAGLLGEEMRATSEPAAPHLPFVVQLPANLDWLEKRAIEAALCATSGNRKQAAAILGINRVTLYKKLKADGVE